MRREIILHIGTSKTGSTSIQRVLSRQREALAQQGVCYPATPGSESHVLLVMAAAASAHLYGSADRPIWQGIGPQARLARFREEFAAEMAALPKTIGRVIISAEQFSLLLRDPQSVQNLRTLLAPYAWRIRVIVYLRRQDRHFVSLYNELLRAGNAPAPNLLEMAVHPQYNYNYATLLNRWVRVFGRLWVTPRLFEAPAGQRFDVVEDFLGVCGLQLDLEAERAARAANPAISHAGQQILVALAERIRARESGHHWNVQSPLWRTLTASVASALTGPGWRPTQAEAREFLARYDTPNESVRQRWFPDQHTLFAMDFADLPQTPVLLDDAALLQAALQIILDMAAAVARRQDDAAADVARLAELTGQRDAQRAALARRLQIDPDNADARLQLASLHLDEGDRDAARYCIEAALRTAPSHPAAPALQARLLEPP
jgi:tetratricopeptide (TPR) repeat protein